MYICTQKRAKMLTPGKTSKLALPLLNRIIADKKLRLWHKYQ